MGFFSALPFGPTKDPVKRLSLHTTWANLPEKLVTDDNLRSDLDPEEAPIWSVSVLFDEQPHCLLGKLRQICS